MSGIGAEGAGGRGGGADVGCWERGWTGGGGGGSGGWRSVAHRSSNALGCKPTDPMAVDSNVNGLSSTTKYSCIQSIQVMDSMLGLSE